MSERSQIIQQIPLFQNIASSWIEQFATHSHPLQCKRGQVLFQQGDACHGFYYLITGQVKLVLRNLSGQEKVLEIISAGMTFGEAVVFINKPFPVNAEAITASELLYIDAATLLDAIQHDSALALRMLANISMRLHSLVKDIESSCLHSATQRVVGFLLAESHEQRCVGNKFSLTLPVSKSLVAAHLNLTPETFSRVLQRLCTETLISLEGRCIHIHDLAHLQGFEQCSS